MPFGAGWGWQLELLHFVVRSLLRQACVVTIGTALDLPARALRRWVGRRAFGWG